MGLKSRKQPEAEVPDSHFDWIRTVFKEAFGASDELIEEIVKTQKEIYP